jgi:hypothetical protein
LAVKSTVSAEASAGRRNTRAARGALHIFERDTDMTWARTLMNKGSSW